MRNVNGGASRPARPALAVTDTAGVRHARHPIVMFSIVATALAMSTLDNTIVATALDTLQRSLGASIPIAAWTITAYSLGMILALSLTSELTGRYGARHVFLLSVSLFTAASLCCGLVDDIHALIALRFVQGAAAAGFTPSATRIVVDYFGAARDKALGLFGSLFTLGALVGPIVGGVIVEYWSWRGVFLVNVPIGIVLVLLCVRYVPGDRLRSVISTTRIDFGGLALLGGKRPVVSHSTAGNRMFSWALLMVERIDGRQAGFLGRAYSGVASQ